MHRVECWLNGELAGGIYGVAATKPLRAKVIPPGMII